MRSEGFDSEVISTERDFRKSSLNISFTRKDDNDNNDVNDNDDDDGNDDDGDEDNEDDVDDDNDDDDDDNNDVDDDDDDIHCRSGPRSLGTTQT